jgi:protein SCO1/2
MKRLAPWLFIASLLTGQAFAATPLPADSVYQLHVTLTDQDGHAQPFAARRGQVQLVSMIYTSCTMVCPMIVDTMKLTRKAVAEPGRDKLALLAVSFDPERDSLDALRHYAAARKLDMRYWTLARPQPKDARPLAALLGLQYRQLPDGDFNHSSELILLDTDGRIAARTSVIGRVDPEFVNAVNKALEPH